MSATQTCVTCDAARERDGQKHLIGKPCDICAGSGTTYLGGSCRHVPHDEPYRSRL